MRRTTRKANTSPSLLTASLQPDGSGVEGHPRKINLNIFVVMSCWDVLLMCNYFSISRVLDFSTLIVWLSVLQCAGVSLSKSYCCRSVPYASVNIHIWPSIDLCWRKKSDNCNSFVISMWFPRPRACVYLAVTNMLPENDFFIDVKLWSVSGICSLHCTSWINNSSSTVSACIGNTSAMWMRVVDAAARDTAALFECATCFYFSMRAGH